MPSSSLKRSASSVNSPKSVRFSDTPTTSTTDDEAAARAALFPYRDDPNDQSPPDQSNLDNTQIHAYHSQVMRDQDEQLDRLGESIGRQRELSIQIGDELDGQVALLEDMDGHVERHHTRLEGARKRLGTVARKAKDNVQLTIILILIIILVLLIIILK
jgi:syntaxin 8